TGLMRVNFMDLSRFRSRVGGWPTPLELDRRLNVPSSRPGENAFGITERAKRGVALDQVLLVEQVADAGGDLPAIVDAELDRGVSDEVGVLLDDRHAAGDEHDARRIAAVEPRRHREAIVERDLVTDREIAL